MNSWAGAVLAAAGVGRRFGLPKQYLKLGGKPLLHYSLEALGGVDDVRKIVVVVAPADVALARELVEEWVSSKDAGKAARRCSAGDLSLDVAPGGERRQDSVRFGLERLRGAVEWCLVHDAARPLLRPRDVLGVLDAARLHGAAVLGTPVTDSVKRVTGGDIVEELPRQEIWTVQTPQAASVEALLEAYDKAGEREFTDEASALRALGARVVVVEGPRENLKITRPGDDLLAELLLGRREGTPLAPGEKG
jgi:2-C-methyl-D-erythritol 4-phosphate cytidylyltransferase